MDNVVEMIDNKWKGENPFFNHPELPDKLMQCNALFPLRTILDPSFGSQITLILVDQTDFIYELGKINPFALYLQTGYVKTKYGPLLFLLFFIPNLTQPNKPFYMHDEYVNSLDPTMMAIWKDLSRQKYWHLFLIDKHREQVRFFEFINEYELSEALDISYENSKNEVCIDFKLVKQEFCNLYSLEDLYKLY